MVSSAPIPDLPATPERGASICSSRSKLDDLRAGLSRRQTRLAQTGKEPLPIVRAGERPVQTLIARGKVWHASQQLIEGPAGVHRSPQMPVGAS
jgi:hypothetical protein